ncbi:unnamed protein product [Heligmosomoides polygyrus]|uniref:Peptidase A2 domain-containing protein n=1 Tax=Heligmosomoides polygyrus TaxID=6339 RepID=A0A183G3D7_HELPZ|nr:unnamed protein product [Heligmosomoides polygyrus]
MAVRDKERGTTELVGDRMTATLSLLGGESPALLDTGSMISIIPVETLAKVQDRGVDVDALQFLQKSELRPVFDASNNLMHFLGAVYIEVELRGGKSSKVAFHISPGKEEEIILGTNALRKLGVDVSITDVDNSRGTCKERNKDNVVVVGRIYNPPNEAAVVDARCEAESAEISERVIWPSREGISAGVYRIQNQLTQIPVFNSSHQPMLLKAGESIGHWGTDKWFERWEDLNPLMPSEENEIGCNLETIQEEEEDCDVEEQQQEEERVEEPQQRRGWIVEQLVEEPQEPHRWVVDERMEEPQQPYLWFEDGRVEEPRQSRRWVVEEWMLEEEDEDDDDDVDESNESNESAFEDDGYPAVIGGKYRGELKSTMTKIMVNAQTDLLGTEIGHN